MRGAKVQPFFKFAKPFQKKSFVLPFLLAISTSYTTQIGRKVLIALQFTEGLSHEKSAKQNQSHLYDGGFGFSYDAVGSNSY